MDAGTKEMIHGIIDQAKKLEGLMKELDSPLNDVQKRNLDSEMIHIDSALCCAECIYSVVTRIDDALHHPKEYSEPEPTPPYDGSAESVYNRLCEIRKEWKDIFFSDSIDKRKHAFLAAHVCFSQWTNEIFIYTEYLGRKYGLLPSEVRIGSDRMVDLGVYNPRFNRVSYNRRLVQDPSYALITVIHELCHVRHPTHSREFWKLYEDVCISEGILLDRVLGNHKSLRELKIEDIPYRWKPEIDYFTSNMQITIDKSIRASRYSSKSFTE